MRNRLKLNFFLDLEKALSIHIRFNPTLKSHINGVRLSPRNFTISCSRRVTYFEITKERSLKNSFNKFFTENNIQCDTHAGIVDEYLNRTEETRCYHKEANLLKQLQIASFQRPSYQELNSYTRLSEKILFARQVDI